MNDKNRRIEELTHGFRLGNRELQEIGHRLLNAMEIGLSRDGHIDAVVKMFPTYVRQLPSGAEMGKFLALDLGGTNFRVLLIELDGTNKIHMDSRIFAIPHQIMLGSGEKLFDHIADCISSFVKEFGIQNERLPLGFTFSFPCKQNSLTKAKLVRWTKGFKCSGVEGNDVVQLLKESVSRRGDINIDVMALVNDTTGTLMSCAHKNPQCRIGIILGTGTNACYVESLEKVQTWDSDFNDPCQVLINTEWGAFGSGGELDFIRTPQDRELDNSSLNPGLQIYEKMISGMYMGELVRLVLRDLTRENLLFDGQSSELLDERGTFYTKYLSEIESEPENDMNTVKMIMEEMGLSHATDEDCKYVRYVCSLVSQRAAHLSAIGCAVLINRVNQPNVAVGVDGSVYRFHPHFHDLMVDKITELINPGLRFELMLSEDGSGRGAALVAAVAKNRGRAL